MPPRGKSKKRRRRKKKAVSGTGTGGLSLTSFPFGKKKLVKHRYVEKLITINPSAGSIAGEHYFSCNGLYDPNITGVGHQPMGYDSLVPIFDHWVVIASKINFWFKSIDPTNPQLVTLSVDDDITLIPGIDQRIENGTARWKLLAPNSNSAGDQIHQMSMSCNPNKFLTIPNPIGNSQVEGSSGANPSEQCFYCISCAPTGSSIDAVGIECTVIIDYTAVWYEPRNLSQS